VVVVVAGHPPVVLEDHGVHRAQDPGVIRNLIQQPEDCLLVRVSDVHPVEAEQTGVSEQPLQVSLAESQVGHVDGTVDQA
jgi:hypothetical protein